MAKPKLKLLDTFCKAGGAGYGYHLAGFDVVGVDIEHQPRYPFDFHQANALEFIAKYGHDFDVIHASPPCQAYSPLNYLHKRDYPDLIESVRELLITTGKLYIIENLPQAPLKNPIMLCGTMFGLLTIRHRAFETNPVLWFPPSPCQHWGKSTPKGHHSTFANGDFITITGHNFLVDEARAVYGTPWMTRDDLREAIPPVYTKWLGEQIINKMSRSNRHGSQGINS